MVYPEAVGSVRARGDDAGAVTDTASWESVIGPLAAAYWRHAAVLWLAMTHLTLAGASADQVHGGVVRLMGLLAGEPEQASPQVKSRPNVRAMARNSADAMAPVMAAAGAAGRKAGLGLKQAATIAAPIARDLARRGYQSGKTHWQAWHVRQKAKRVARSEQLAREREAAAAKHAAKLEADRLRQVQAHAGDGDAGDHQPLRLKGSALRSSVVGTWLMLVILSWVALLWGAILSIPFGVGIALIASFMGGMVAVPLWGTIFGFLGMSGARSSTLHAMGYEPLDPHHVLAGACAGYCEILDIPMPRLGTIKPFNAFAMGLDHRNATVAIGRPLIEQMSTDEAKAVLAHELGHVVSGDMRKMMLMRTFQNATVWFMLGQGLKQFARWIICWVAELAILAFSRHREYWADAVGAALAGKEAMIGALLKLDGAPSLSPAERTHARFMVRGRPFSTHPSIQQRIAALEKGTYLKRLPVRSPS